MAKFTEGDPVVIEGLSRRQDLNGQWGTCLESVIQDSGRIAVTTGFGESIKIKPENLQLDEFCAGFSVRMVGLSRNELNGLVGSLSSFDSLSGRWLVEVLDEVFRLRPKNIVRVKQKPYITGTQAESQASLQAFCRDAVPSWRHLGNNVELQFQQFEDGTSSLVLKVSLHSLPFGSGAEGVMPRECVYVQKTINGENMQRAFNNLTLQAGSNGVGPRVFAMVGRHRVEEFCPGPLLFGGTFSSHFLGNLDLWSKPFAPGPADDAALMRVLGKTIGRVHAMPLDWLSDAVGEVEFKKRLAEPRLWPRNLDHSSQVNPMLEDLMIQVKQSKVIPRHGLFQHAVTCHGDLHGGNVICGKDVLPGESKIVVIDWENFCCGHRGMDLSYLFLNAPGASLDSRRAFAKAYIEAQHAEDSPPDVTPQEVDDLLWDIERCMPLALLHMAHLALIFQGMLPLHCSDMLELCTRVMDAFMELDDTRNPEVLKNGVVRDVQLSGGM